MVSAGGDGPDGLSGALRTQLRGQGMRQDKEEYLRGALPLALASQNGQSGQGTVVFIFILL